ncbi:hypothetical protein [Halomicronema sp. CCY15110]|uniref:hypothetical protein n=1 Tax=Halomicronema sp. CCY15110 TaxID=2767773 RepID=UPI00194E28AD|nr:hypothetical protein [Halomicronema sp. CCY15110]
MRWKSHLTLGAAGLLTVLITQWAVAHTGHPHGETATTPTAPETTTHARPSHSAALAQEMQHPFGGVVAPAVQLAEQVEFTAVAAIESGGLVAQLASPAGLGGLGETTLLLVIGAPMLLYVARDRCQKSA